MVDSRRTTDGHRGVTLDVASHLVTNLTFTTAKDVAILSSALTSSANRTASDGHFGIATDTRFLSTAIDTFSNGSRTVDGKSGCSCYGAESCQILGCIEDVTCVIHP